MRPPPALAYESSPGCASRTLPRTYRRRQPETTPFYRVVAQHLESFLGEGASDGHGPPWFVEKEFRGYLACGILAHGFARLQCGDCHDEYLVAFSCKGRAICPSCTTRRMHDTAAHLVDRVLPRVPVRQWVLTFPPWMRPALAYNAALLSGALTRFIRALFAFQRRRARALGLPTTRARTSGTVTFLQRFGSALQLTPHAHTLLPDGVFVANPQEPERRPRFVSLSPPSQDEVAAVLAKVARSVESYLRAQGVPGPDEADAVHPSHGSPWLDALSGEASSIPARRKRGTAHPPLELPPPPRTAWQAGFTLHADREVPPNDRQQLEELCRYGLRPAISVERLDFTQEGQVRYRMKRTFADGTSEIVLAPTAFLRRVAALVPRPRVHMTRYHGLFAPRARGRPGPNRSNRSGGRPATHAELGSRAPEPQGPGPDRLPTHTPSASALEAAPDGASDPGFERWARDPGDRGDPLEPMRPRRLPWADLLRRVHPH